MSATEVVQGAGSGTSPSGSDRTGGTSLTDYSGFEKADAVEKAQIENEIRGTDGVKSSQENGEIVDWEGPNEYVSRIRKVVYHLSAR